MTCRNVAPSISTWRFQTRDSTSPAISTWRFQTWHRARAAISTWRLKKRSLAIVDSDNSLRLRGRATSNRSWCVINFIEILQF